MLLFIFPLLPINKIISFNIFLVEKINKNVVQMSRLGGKSNERNVNYKRADTAQKVALACFKSTAKVKPIQEMAHASEKCWLNNYNNKKSLSPASSPPLKLSAFARVCIMG